LENAALTHMSDRLFTKERIKKLLAGVVYRSKPVINRTKNLRNRLFRERRELENRLK